MDFPAIGDFRVRSGMSLALLFLRKIRDTRRLNLKGNIDTLSSIVLQNPGVNTGYDEAVI